MLKCVIKCITRCNRWHFSIFLYVETGIILGTVIKLSQIIQYMKTKDIKCITS